MTIRFSFPVGGGGAKLGNSYQLSGLSSLGILFY